jgi:hypothetical protein
MAGFVLADSGSAGGGLPNKENDQNDNNPNNSNDGPVNTDAAF